MKKTILLLLIILGFLLYEPVKMVRVERHNVNLYKKINTTLELEKKIESNDYTIIYFYKKDCVACNTFKEVLNNSIENKKNIIYGVDLNGKELSYTDLVTKYNLIQTPTVVIFKSNNEIKRLEGATGKNEFNKFVSIGDD